MEEINLEPPGEELTTASLADVLASRSKFLEEQELWALCRECCLTLEYVNSHVELFQTMYISPDTVAFDTEGNVCFLDLDMDPDPMFIAPEIVGNERTSYKSHLFSLGMTLLAATEYNTRSVDPGAELSDTFTELLASMTNENTDDRPDLYTVLDACDKALGDQHSQDICYNIIGNQRQEINSSIDSCKSQSDEHIDHTTSSLKLNQNSHSLKDVNDNCVQKKPLQQLDSTKEFESSSLEKTDTSLHQKSVNESEHFKKQRLTLGEVLNNLDRYLNEAELWALCSECIWYLQRKRKHLPAYISPDTVVLFDTGKVRSKPASEEKLLEMIYMAPELQQKGTVSEKTCLYGLGKTLQSSTGHKYSSTMEDSEALDILIQAFTQSSPEKRPTFETAYEMCQEYEKCNRANYQNVLQSLYKEASAQLMIMDVSTHNGINSVFEKTTESSQQSNAALQGQLEKMSQNSPSDDNEPSSAFKPVMQTVSNKAKNGRLNVPPAFSSPATHFKPIVIEHSSDPQNPHSEEQTVKQAGKDTTVVAKLKEIKDTMLKHQKSHTDHTVLDKLKGSSVGESKATRTSQMDRKAEESVLSQPPQANSLNEQIPNADILVSAIAQYLKTHLTKDISNEPRSPPFPGHADGGLVYQGSSYGPAYHSANFPSQPPSASHTTHPSRSNTILTSATSLLSSTQPVSYKSHDNLVHPPDSYKSHDNLVHPPVSNSSLPRYLHTNMNISPQFPSSVIISSSSLSGTSGGYPVIYTGVPPSSTYGGPSLGYYQDPAVRMTAPTILPFQFSQHSHNVPYIQQYSSPMQDSFTQRQYPQYCSDPDYQRSKISQSRKLGFQHGHSGIWQEGLNQHQGLQHRASQNESVNQRFTDMSLKKDLHSSSPDSPSPSLSKDSGIYMTQQNDHHNSQRQSPLFYVLQIIRDHCTTDGTFDTGSEEVAMTEYILSLRSLKWETFCSAVTEKYCHLSWSHDLLNRLYLAISGPPPQSHTKPNNPVDVTVKAQLTHQKQPFNPQSGSFYPSPTEGHATSPPSMTTHIQRVSSSLKPDYQKPVKSRPASVHHTSLDTEGSRTAVIPPSLLNSSNGQSFPSPHVGTGSLDRVGHRLNQITFNRLESTKDTTSGQGTNGRLNHSTPSFSYEKEQSAKNFLIGGHEHLHHVKPYAISLQPHQNPHKQSLSQVKSTYESSPVTSIHNYIEQGSVLSHTAMTARLPNTYRRPPNRASRAPSAPVTLGSQSYYEDEVSPEVISSMSAEMRKLSAELFKDSRKNPTANKMQASVPAAKLNQPKLAVDQVAFQEHSNSDQHFSEAKRDVIGQQVTGTGNDTGHQKKEEDVRGNGNINMSGMERNNMQDVNFSNSVLNPVLSNGFTPPENGPRDQSKPVFNIGHSSQPIVSPDKGTNNIGRSSATYNRSLSAVYTRQPVETGLKVTDLNIRTANHQRTASAGSLENVDIHSPLLQYVKKSYVVYHSAMIQLSLTPEVNAFMNSIDEENKTAIELRMAVVRQEILVLKRERKKSQKFYRRLNENKTTKGDQHVSHQTLKELSDVARKLSFLLLCQTHLQMLLAELNGLDSRHLYSLSASEGTLQLQTYIDNPYLQFRTIPTSDSCPMSVLQAGSPRGLMSYLYKSSALSDGYIHQFLLCFRYILTSEQLLAFLLDKCRASQSSKMRDINLINVERRSLDLIHFWMEGFYSIDFALDRRLLSKLVDFLKEQMELNVEGADNLFSLYSACKMGDHSELMLMTELDEDEEDGDGAYYLKLSSPARWNSFRSLLKFSKPVKGGSHLSKTRSEQKLNACAEGQRSSMKFSISDCPAHVLAEQLTLLEQEFFRKCHPVHFLNSQFQGVGVALSMPGLRTPSMSRKSEPSTASKKGLFVGDPVIQSCLVDMITHSHELAHWLSIEVLTCGSHKSQVSLLTKFLTVAHLCLNVRNFATALSILDGLENLVVKQLPVWKDVPAKYISYMNELANTKIKLKSETTWLMSEKDWHLQPTIPCALYVALQIQQLEIGSFTLANGMYKWDKMRSISEAVDQLRVFRDHEYGFQIQPEVQMSLKRSLREYSDKDLHVVASTQENNFRRHSSTSSLTGTLKRMKEKLQSIKK
ncbi:hypothetical protein Btru_069231 [Bulinus truncatus]|nr:hypothetical protein Btru_069231 [Bulinus truncatus]